MRGAGDVPLVLCKVTNGPSEKDTAPFIVLLHKVYLMRLLGSSG